MYRNIKRYHWKCTETSNDTTEMYPLNTTENDTTEMSQNDTTEMYRNTEMSQTIPLKCPKTSNDTTETQNIKRYHWNVPKHQTIPRNVPKH